jgi:CBS domain-containing protein
MQVREIMTPSVKTIAADASLREAAQMMAAQDCGSLPVAQGDRIVGMVTDRDITLRAVANSKDPDTCTVQEVMSEEIKYLFDDESTEDLVRNIGTLQIRRLPVLNREKRLVGIVSLGDLALRSEGTAAESALRSVSTPSSEAPIAG